MPLRTAETHSREYERKEREVVTNLQFQNKSYFWQEKKYFFGLVGVCVGLVAHPDICRGSTETYYFLWPLFRFGGGMFAQKCSVLCLVGSLYIAAFTNCSGAEYETYWF